MFDITTDTSEYKSFRVIFTTGSAISSIDVKAMDWCFKNHDLVFSKKKINDDEDDLPNENLIATFDANYIVGIMENNT